MILKQERVVSQGANKALKGSSYQSGFTISFISSYKSGIKFCLYCSIFNLEMHRFEIVNISF